MTITGTNLSGATAVHFGANVATGVIVNSATSVSATSPAGTGTVDVTVTTPGGTSAANPPGDQFTYNAAPTVTNVNPNNGPQAGGNTVTVTGSGFVSGSTTVDFASTAGTSVNVSELHQPHRHRPGRDRHGLGDRDHHQRRVLDPLGRCLHLQRSRADGHRGQSHLGNDRRWHVRDHHRHQPERGRPRCTSGPTRPPA